MAITTRAGLIAAASTQFSVPMIKTVTASTTATLYSQWIATGWPVPGIAPTVAATCTNSTLGAVAIPTAATGASWYLSALTATGTGTLILFDRLATSPAITGSSLSSGTALTTSVPAPPARVTDTTSYGLYLEVYGAFTSNTTIAVSVSYTNTAGTAGRAGALPEAMGTSPPAGSLYGPFALADTGTVGVSTVQSVTFSGSVPTAGTFGLTLLRPVALLPLNGPATESRLTYLDAGLMALGVDPCLMFANTSGSYRPTGSLSLIQA